MTAGLVTKDIISNELNTLAEFQRPELPTLPIVFGQTVLERDHRITPEPIIIEPRHRFGVAISFIGPRESVLPRDRTRSPQDLARPRHPRQAYSRL